MMQGKHEEAARAFEQALGTKPDFVDAHSNRLLSLHYRPDTDAETIIDETRRWAAQHTLPLATVTTPHSNDRKPHRRLRVGYVSADLRSHSVAYFIEALLGAHDRESIEVFRYANVKGPDAVTERALPNARVHGLTLEFGTYGPLRVLHLLRAENHLHHHGEIGSALGRKIKAHLRECFCPADPRWRADVLKAGASVLTRACAALATASGGDG